VKGPVTRQPAGVTRSLLVLMAALLVGAAILRGVAPMLQTTELSKVDLAGLDLRDKSFAGKVLTEVNFRGCDLRGVSFRGAMLWEADLREARLDGADFAGALYDAATRWPTGFDPRSAGATRDEGSKARKARDLPRGAKGDRSGKIPVLRTGPHERSLHEGTPPWLLYLTRRADVQLFVRESGPPGGSKTAGGGSPKAGGGFRRVGE
jgi:hypothetical protein